MLGFVVLALTFESATVHAQTVPTRISVNARVTTTSVIDDADDPAIWIHPDTPSLSLIIGTDKGDEPDGGLFVWDLNGVLQQRLNINHPNNADVRSGFSLQGTAIPIVAVTMREDDEIRIFGIDPNSRTLSDITTESGIPVFRDPYGICLYRRPNDAAMFAIVSNNVDGTKRLWQLLLEDDGTGKVRGTKVREFGSIEDVVEGLVADDELGYLYAAEESEGVHKFHADPEMGNQRLALFATGDGIEGDREGLALYKCEDGTGYLLLSSQGNSTVKVYPRKGAQNNPHQHDLITTIDTKGSEETDGLDVTSLPAAPNFPHGFLITHNSPDKNFKLYAWEDIAQTFLRICSNTTRVGNGPGISINDFILEQNYPNPFNASTIIRYFFAKEGHASLAIYNLKGQEIRRLADRFHSRGAHSETWDGLDNQDNAAPSGVYYYRLRFGGHAITEKLILLR